MIYKKAFIYLFFLNLFFQSKPSFAQSIKQEKMEQLNFLVGEWTGTTKVYENGTVTKEGPAFEKVYYDLDKSILVIELNTVYLQLRTIITYNEKDENYTYHRFSKDGAGRVYSRI